MTTEQAVKACYARWRDLKGRAQRSEFWQFYLFCACILACAKLADEWLVGTAGFSFSLLYIAVFLATLPPTLSCSVRRYHDIGMSGWLLIVWPAVILAPAFSFSEDTAFIVLCIFVFVFLMTFALPSQPGSNKYGPNPHEAPQ
ncbi:DUF805 domain-containing protein [Leisingera sp. S232]|uniref:DUF805 domain-containing protein n=1 Tax=Leisingera sp. S232 TaxID=3415132 RepID=UPI00086ECB0F|nr:hypothetical protein AB838_20000 [Rhodobacteraceae bacterium (ex Bugula neritina AB1)]